jgi:hypothetical protein
LNAEDAKYIKDPEDTEDTENPENAKDAEDTEDARGSEGSEDAGDAGDAARSVDSIRFVTARASGRGAIAAITQLIRQLVGCTDYLFYQRTAFSGIDRLALRGHTHGGDDAIGAIANRRGNG